MSIFINYTNRKQYQTYRAHKALISVDKAKISKDIFVEKNRLKKKFYCVDTDKDFTCEEFFSFTNLDEESFSKILLEAKINYEENGNQLLFTYNGFTFKKL